MKKKILFVVHQLNHGGVQKAALSALNAIDYSKNEVTLYIRKNRTDLIAGVNPCVKTIIINEDSTHYYRKPRVVVLMVLKKLGMIIRSKTMTSYFQEKLAKELNDLQFQYEKEKYFHTEEIYDIAISYIQGYNAKFVAQHINAKKKIMFYHGSTDETHNLHEEIMPCFDIIVGVNKNVQKVLEGLYPSNAHKMTYIENYVDADEIKEKSKLFDVKHPVNKKVICSCGRFTPIKGFDIAVKTAKILKDKGLDFLWYFVGDGPERTVLEGMIKEHGLTDYIQITGMQDNPYPFIRCCDIYVQPSREESHSLTMMEAFILNKPVVSTKTIGGKTLVEGTEKGLIASINEDDIAEKIMILMHETELYNQMKAKLKDIDYSDSLLEYMNAWKKVLEE